VGFQAKGTTGRKIVDGARQVKIFGENVSVRAKVFTIGGFSAHADQNDLLQWIGHFESNPQVFLVHGEDTASAVLATKIREQFNLVTHIPRWREGLILRAKEAGYEEPQTEAVAADLGATVLDTVTHLEKELKALKKRIKSMEWEDRTGEEELDRLRYIQEELQAMFSQ
jgi:metallo-beta-lactamase family protein